MANEEWLEEYRKEYVKFIEKYNDKSWKWIPTGVKKDLQNIQKIQIQRYADVGAELGNKGNVPYFARALVDKETLGIFLELEKTITNPYFFWSMVAYEYMRSDFQQSVLLDWIDAFTRDGRVEKTKLEERQKCADGIWEQIKNKNPKKVNSQLWKALKDESEIIIYRGASIADEMDVRLGRKKIDNPNADQQDGGLGFSYTLDKKCAEYFANILSVKDEEMIYGVDKIGDVPSFIDVDSINETSRRVVTKHTIKKEKILFYSDFGHESEIVALPDDVVLVRYDFMKFIEKVPHPTSLHVTGTGWFMNEESKRELLKKFGSLSVDSEGTEMWKPDKKKIEQAKTEGEEKALKIVYEAVGAFSDFTKDVE